MLVEDIVVETCISNRKTCEFSCVSIRVPATFNSSRDQSEIEQLLIEIASMSTQITNEVTNFGPDGGVSMYNQILQVVIDVGVVNGLIEFL